MSSPITMSGFNNIDFNLILNSIMEQEKTPLTALQTQQQLLKAQSTAFASLATKLSALSSASKALEDATIFSGRRVSTTAESIVTAETTGESLPGIYDVVVQELARAQVTTSSSTHDDTDTTTVATGGTITIGGVAVTLQGSVTLKGLVDAINSTDGIGVRASIVSPSSGHYQMVLTGLATGAGGGFTIDPRALTGSTVTFTDTDEDGVSGDSAGDNKMQAVDAQLLVNNVTVSSATNTVTDAIPGTTLTLLRKSTDVVGVSVTETSDTAESAVTEFVDAFNALSAFIKQQKSTNSRFARDPLLRSLQSELREKLGAEYAVGGTLTSLPAAGIGFSRDGQLTLDSERLASAIADHQDDLKKLFGGYGGTTGAFGTFTETIESYTDAGALIANSRDRIDSQIRAMDTRLAAMEERLANRRASLQREFIAADMTISQLNSQSGSLASLGSGYRLF